jgi:hypothetical protein
MHFLCDCSHTLRRLLRLQSHTKGVPLRDPPAQMLRVSSAPSTHMVGQAVELQSSG